MDFVAVMAAGFMGAAARSLLSDALPAGQTYGFPLTTLAINIFGCFILSYFMHRTMDKLVVSPRLRLAVSVGFLGAFTTFSTYTIEAFSLFQSGFVWAAVLYIIGTPLGCMFAAWLGVIAGRNVKQPPAVREERT